jgi:heme/copper-type cytochrome/quinol oxidase subunit 4
MVLGNNDDVKEYEGNASGYYKMAAIGFVVSTTIVIVLIIIVFKKSLLSGFGIIGFVVICICTIPWIYLGWSERQKAKELRENPDKKPSYV